MMSKVLSCGAMACSYNQNKECHASAVEVGSGHATCDTFTRTGAPLQDAMPGVSSCHITDCKFNEGLNCQAPGITVWTHEQHADCATFLPMS